MSGLAARNKAIFYKDLQKIKENYSNGNNRVRKFEDIKLLFIVLKYKEPEELYIDDQTYLDLNMDNVFKKVDRTFIHTRNICPIEGIEDAACGIGNTAVGPCLLNNHYSDRRMISIKAEQGYIVKVP